MRSVSILVVAAAAILTVLATGIGAKKVENCTAPGYVSPTGLTSKHEICTTSAMRDAEKKAKEEADKITGGFSATSVNAEQRNGKALMNKILAMTSGGEFPQDDAINYVQALIVLIVPPAAFFLLNLCCCFWCSCMRGCCWICPGCCRCCKCLPSDEHTYSKCSKCAPGLVWLILTLCVFVFAIMGVITGTYKLVDSSSTSVCTWDNVYIRFTAFLSNVEAPLNQLDKNFQSAVEDMKNATEFPASLEQGLVDVGDSLAVVVGWSEKAKDRANAGLTGNDPLKPKPECIDSWTKIIEKAENAKKSTYDSAEELNNVLRDIQKTIKKDIVEQSADVRKTIADSKISITDMKKQLNESMNPEDLGMFTYAQVSRAQRDNAAFSQWGWIFLVVVFAIIGIVGMTMCKIEVNYEPDGLHPRSNPNLSGNAMKLNTLGGCCARFASLSWCIYLVFAIFGALFALIFLPLTAVVSDACLVLPELPKRLGEITGAPTIQNISDTCWNKTGNLFDGFGINEVMNTDDIDFGDLASSREDPEISTKGLDLLEQALNDMKSEMKYCYDEANSDSSERAVDNLRTSIDTSRTKVEQAEKNFAEDTTAERIANRGKDLIFTVDEAICQFRNAATCNFIAVAWEDVSNLICNEVNASISNMALYELLVAALAIPYALAMLCLNKRLGGHGPVKMDDTYAVDAKEINAIELADGAYYN